MIALPANKVVNSLVLKMGLKNSDSVTCFSGSGFELIQLGIALAGEPTFRSLAVKVGIRAIIKSGVRVDPNLSVGISFILRDLRGFS